MCVFLRYVKSDRSVLLVHMCVVLVLAYVTFLAGVNRVENEVRHRDVVLSFRSHHFFEKHSSLDLEKADFHSGLADFIEKLNWDLLGCFGFICGDNIC